RVDPDSTALRSSQSEEELLDGARNNPAGIPGARANLPGAEDQGQVGFRQNVRRELRTQNFSVPKTTRNILESPGSLKRVSVAVVVDGVNTVITAEDGTTSETWQARDPAELQKYEDLVKSAIGFSGARGESVKVEIIKFQQEDFSESNRL